MCNEKAVLLPLSFALRHYPPIVLARKSSNLTQSPNLLFKTLTRTKSYNDGRHSICAHRLSGLVLFPEVAGNREYAILSRFPIEKITQAKFPVKRHTSCYQFCTYICQIKSEIFGSVDLLKCQIRPCISSSTKNLKAKTHEKRRRQIPGSTIIPVAISAAIMPWPGKLVDQTSFSKKTKKKKPIIQFLK